MCAGGRASVLDRTEAAGMGSSCSVSYLNFGSALIFLVISAMVVSVRDNFGATPRNRCKTTCLEVSCAMSLWWTYRQGVGQATC